MDNNHILCTSCNKGKPTSDFYKRKPRGIFGRKHSYSCKECIKENRNREDEYWEEKYKTSKYFCHVCFNLKTGFNDKEIAVKEDSCAKCLKKQGFKYCKKCKVKKLNIEFYDKKAECIDCFKEEGLNDYFECPKCLLLYPLKSKHNVKECNQPFERKCVRCFTYKQMSEFKSERICKLCFNKNYKSLSKLYLKEIRQEGLNKKERVKDACLWQNYKITIHDYNSIVEQQNGKCLICKQESDELVVDHDHTTGEIRGLLCSKCNIGLGFFKDSEDLLKAAAEYLETCKHG